MKRIISLVLTLLTLCALFASPLSSMAATTAAVTLEQVSAEAGTSVQVRMTLTGNPGLVAMLATIKFDTKVLQLTGAENGDVFPDASATFGADMTGDTFKLTWLDALTREDYTADGTLAVLTFSVLPTANAGKTTIELTLDRDSIFDHNLKCKTVVGQNGSVTVSAPTVPVSGVTLSQDTLTLEVGQSSSLTATVTPPNATNRSVTWSSSAPAVASVDENGKVTAKSVGDAIITVTTTDGGKTATCSVAVKPATVRVTGVSVSPATLTLDVGGASTLSATVAPSNATDKSVIWSSSAPAVAAVNENGKVTAVAPGTAVITVTTKDGGKTAKCSVTVRAPYVSVTGVALPASLTINYKTAYQMTATVAPDNATNKAVQWSSSNAKVLEVDANGKLTSHRAGTATITATTADGGKTASCSVTVQYTFMQKIIIYVLFGWLWYVK